MIPNIDLTPLLYVLAISVPLGLWKLIEIIWWLVTHVTVSW